MRPTTFKVGKTIPWSIRTYTEAGQLVDADSNPTVAVLRDGDAVNDAVTVTKRASTTGIYDCRYTPAGEVEGEIFEIVETVLISTEAFENAWNMECQAVERGTDGANTVAPATPTNVSDSTSTIEGRLDSVDTVIANIENTQAGLDIIITNTLAPNQTTMLARIAEVREVTDKLDTTLAVDGSNYQFTVDALALAPTGSGGGGGDATASNQTAILNAVNNLDFATPANVSDSTSTIEGRLNSVDTVIGNIENEQAGLSIVITNTLAPNQTTMLARLSDVKSVTDKLDTTLSVNGSNYQFTVDALALAPTGSGGGGGDSAATIYNYFVSGNRELPFVATGFAEPSDIASQTATLEARFDNVDSDNLATSVVVDSTSSNVISVLTDTNDLVSTKGQRVTATGFATPSDITAQTATLESRFNSVDSDNAATELVVDAMSARVINILSDTNDLVSTKGQRVTATGFATPANVSDSTNTIGGRLDSVDTALGSVQVVTEKLDTTLAVDGSNYQFTVDALALAPTGSGGGGGGDSAASIYNYFTSNDRQLAFMATGFAEPSDITSQTTTLVARFNAVDADNLIITTEIDSLDADVNAIKGNVETLIANQGDWATATGFVTPSQLDAAVAPLLTESDFMSELPTNFPLLDITVSGLVTSTNGGGSGGGDSAETIYQYFTDGTRADAFMANTQALSLEQTLTDGINSIIVTGNANWSGSGGGGGGGSVTINATQTPRAF